MQSQWLYKNCGVWTTLLSVSIVHASTVTFERCLRRTVQSTRRAAKSTRRTVKSTRKTELALPSHWLCDWLELNWRNKVCNKAKNNKRIFMTVMSKPLWMFLFHQLKNKQIDFHFSRPLHEYFLSVAWKKKGFPRPFAHVLRCPTEISVLFNLSSVLILIHDARLQTTVSRYRFAVALCVFSRECQNPQYSSEQL